MTFRSFRSQHLHGINTRRPARETLLSSNAAVEAIRQVQVDRKVVEQKVRSLRWSKGRLLAVFVQEQIELSLQTQVRAPIKKQTHGKFMNGMMPRIVQSGTFRPFSRARRKATTPSIDDSMRNGTKERIAEVVWFISTLSRSLPPSDVIQDTRARCASPDCAKRSYWRWCDRMIVRPQRESHCLD